MNEYRKQVREALRQQRDKDQANALAEFHANREYKRKFRALRPKEKARLASKKRAQRKADQRCACCTDDQIQAFECDARALGMHIDHCVALALGGPHCVRNMQALTPEQHVIKNGADVSAALRGTIRVLHRFAGRHPRYVSNRLMFCPDSR